MSKALDNAIKAIKDAGFSHIKVELEGDIGRDGERQCNDCDGDARVDCGHCLGEGFLGIDTNDDEETEECAFCYGDGRVDCDSCEGTGNLGSYRDEEFCDEFMKSHVSPEVLSRLTYGNFYEDGSVDSEFTFTVPIENVSDVLEWMSAFSELAEECGELDVSGAGLHIALLPEESNGYYPVDEGTLDRAGVRNFETEVRKLLPALFFLASSGHQSRDLGYRNPNIGEDKYNAISHHDLSCFEFRVFETCYDRPEAFYDYVKTIANCIKFYADPTLKVQALGKQFGFDDGNNVARFYDTPEQLRILNATVKYLKPTDKTYKKLKEERGVKYTIKSLKLKERIRTNQLREDYRRYRENITRLRSREYTEQERGQIEWYRERGYSPSDAVLQVIGRERINEPMTFSQFIKDNLRNSYDQMVSV